MAAGAPFVVRFRVPEGTTEWDDLVHETISFPNKDIEDFVVLRSDGTPIYNMAVVSDDIAMRITHVMRGDDHISNTPKQILLYRALGAELPRFAHFPMIHGLDGKKLSKRHGATAVGDYQHLGILPQAMNNFLALLGWSPGGDREVMTMDEMVQLFSEEGLLKKAAVFDTKKLEWMNGQHLSRLPRDELAPLVTSCAIAGRGRFRGDIARVLQAPRLREGTLPHARRPVRVLARPCGRHRRPAALVRDRPGAAGTRRRGRTRRDARALLTDAVARSGRSRTGPRP